MTWLERIPEDQYQGSYNDKLQWGETKQPCIDPLANLYNRCSSVSISVDTSWTSSVITGDMNPWWCSHLYEMTKIFTEPTAEGPSQAAVETWGNSSRINIQIILLYSI